MAMQWLCPYDGSVLDVRSGNGWFHRRCPACGKQWNVKGKPILGHKSKAIQIPEG